MPFNFKKLEIEGVILIEPKVFLDERGCFAEIFKHNEFKQNGINADFLQDNYSKSHAGVLRGLHFQTHPKAQGKIIHVLQGEIFDVVVDLRLTSPTFKQFIHIVLNGDDNKMLWIPPGLAHGFCVLSDSADIIYKTTAYYDPAAEQGLRWDDPELNIPWPVSNPIISAKDTANHSLSDILKNNSLEFVL